MYPAWYCFENALRIDLRASIFQNFSGEAQTPRLGVYCSDHCHQAASLISGSAMWIDNLCPDSAHVQHIALLVRVL